MAYVNFTTNIGQRTSQIETAKSNLVEDSIIDTMFKEFQNLSIEEFNKSFWSGNLLTDGGVPSLIDNLLKIKSECESIVTILIYFYKHEVITKKGKRYYRASEIQKDRISDEELILYIQRAYKITWMLRALIVSEIYVSYAIYDEDAASVAGHGVLTEYKIQMADILNNLVINLKRNSIAFDSQIKMLESIISTRYNNGEGGILSQWSNIIKWFGANDNYKNFNLIRTYHHSKEHMDNYYLKSEPDINIIWRFYNTKNNQRRRVISYVTSRRTPQIWKMTYNSNNPNATLDSTYFLGDNSKGLNLGWIYQWAKAFQSQIDDPTFKLNESSETPLLPLILFGRGQDYDISYSGGDVNNEQDKYKSQKLNSITSLIEILNGGSQLGLYNNKGIIYNLDELIKKLQKTQSLQQSKMEIQQFAKTFLVKQSNAGQVPKKVINRSLNDVLKELLK